MLVQHTSALLASVGVTGWACAIKLDSMTRVCGFEKGPCELDLSSAC